MKCVYAVIESVEEAWEYDQKRLRYISLRYEPAEDAFFRLVKEKAVLLNSEHRLLLMQIPFGEELQWWPGLPGTVLRDSYKSQW
jgi:hypothetical protein